MGYHRAGFDVIGVDIEPQPRYPFTFIQADALKFIDELITDKRIGSFSAIHASPPCQAYSATKTIWNNKRDHPELIEPTRELLQASGLPWVIENVPGAPLIEPVILCGSMFGLMFNEYQLRRHRLFEVSGFNLTPMPCSHTQPVIGVYGGHGRDRRRSGGRDLPISSARVAMGIDWMTCDQLSEAIPPAYTEYVGEHLATAAMREAA